MHHRRARSQDSASQSSPHRAEPAPAPAADRQALYGNAFLADLVRQGLTLPERSIDPAANASTRGGSGVATAAPWAVLHGSWLGDIGNRLGDALDLRQNEAALDAWEDYEDALDDRAEFTAEAHEVEDFQSATRIGMFDAAYDAVAGVLTATVRCHFDFRDGNTADFPGSTEADVTWSDAAEDRWKTSWLTQSNQTWSGRHTFFCQEDWWEDMTSTVAVNFVESDDSPHYDLDVTMIPSGRFAQSSVGTGRPGGPFGLGRRAGQGTFDSEDLTPTAKPGGTQIGANHEAGHMLGLDDEYGIGTPDHGGMVQDVLGHGVTRGSDDRIMSGGMVVQPEHGVTFIAALRAATDKRWAFAARPPRPAPTDPALGRGGRHPTPEPNGTQTA